MELKVLFPGFSEIIQPDNNNTRANCTCTLIKGPPNIIVDTMTAWDGPKLVEALQKNGLSPDDIDYLICTHGHSDHIGCNYLFQKATHIVGFSISHKETYFSSPDFSKGQEYVINDGVKVIPTPGHTLQDVTVIFNQDEKVYAITGDLFENEQDLDDESIWIGAGSDNEGLQRKHRRKILKLADFIIPGHGAMFAVPHMYHLWG
ncbi:unnamed protein product [Ceutorhynchus assimilis]|uniref:Metallo-beta-lactamase domain-containing protein 1 n=1 Tax=Ceutorhynchus assimilis TaxID=467358 RepID=A0A9N9MC81_9CUCU|nr:unnamed protein product [Ceutorhynchus assimilis]